MVAAHRQSDRLLPIQSRILKFDPQGNELARYEVDTELGGLVIADLAGDGQRNLYTGDSRGLLHAEPRPVHRSNSSRPSPTQLRGFEQ